MNKRILGTFLWFNVGWTAGAMGSFFLGLPEGLNIALALATGALVWFDPSHLLWAAKQTRRIRSADDLVASSRVPATDLVTE
jgi:hypothetical protein